MTEYDMEVAFGKQMLRREAAYKERISELERKLEIATGALKWYADSAMYAGKCDDYQDPNCPIWSETDNDRGARARKALEEIK